MYQLANYVQAGRYGNGGVFGVGSNQKIIEDENLFEALVVVAAEWKTPNSKESIHNKVAQKNPLLADDLISESIQIIIENNFLIRSGVFEVNERYSRNKLYYNMLGSDPDKVQSRLESSVVTIIGCGGIGNHVSYMLATSGVGKLILIDDDHIEISNLTRQVLFNENDINFNKIDVLERELKLRNSRIQIERKSMSIKSIEDVENLESTDLYVVSADYPSQLINWFNKVCVRDKQAYINIGYINDISLIGSFYIPGKTGCFACNNIVPKIFEGDSLQSKLDLIHEGFKPATFAAVNGVAAAYAAGDIIKYLGGFGEIASANKRIGIHSNSIKIEEQPLIKNEKCHIFGAL